MTTIDEACLRKMRTTYRAIRKLVYEKAPALLAGTGLSTKRTSGIFGIR
jgi:DnaJ-domain-containing protein 1